MPTVPILRTTWGTTRNDVMGLTVDGEPTISMITTPPNVNGTRGVWKIDSQDRPGDLTLTMASAPGSRTASFDHWIQDPNPWGNVEALLIPIETAAGKGKRVRFVNGGHILEGKWWWVTNLDIEELEKGRGGFTSRAKLSWQLTEATLVDAVKLTKTGVTKPPATTPPVTSGPTSTRNTDPTNDGNRGTGSPSTGNVAY